MSKYASLSDTWSAVTVFIVLILSVCFKAAFWIRFAYVQRPSLANIPGPRLARWTRLWLVKTLASGESHWRFLLVNRRYGRLARIGPNHLITDCPHTARRISGPTSGYCRGPWYDALRLDSRFRNVVSERDERKHAALRAKLMPSFRLHAITAFEPLVDERISDWTKRLGETLSRACKTHFQIDIGRSLQLLTLDTISKLTIGREFGCVSKDHDVIDILSTTERGQKIVQHLQVFPWLFYVLEYFGQSKTLQRIFIRVTCGGAGIGAILEAIQKMASDQSMHRSSFGKSMAETFLERGLPEAQLSSELLVTLVAGVDTTSSALQSILLAIITNPRAYHTLKDEIANAVMNDSVSHPVSTSQTRQMVYLQACIMEGLRLFPPVTQLRERVVPPEGDFIHGYRVPGGTYIGVDAWSLQRSPVFGEDPDIFRPERWFTGDSGQLKTMHQTHDLIFGSGSSKCLGQAITMMQLGKVIFELLRHFEITVANPYCPWSLECYGIFFPKKFEVLLSCSRIEPPPPYSDMEYLPEDL